MQSIIPIKRTAASSSNYQGRLSELWQDRVIGKALRFSILLIILLFVVIFSFLWRLPPEIPLTYSRPWGTEQLVPSIFLLFLFFLVIIVLLINSFFASLLFSSQQLLARILSWTSVVFILLIDITVMRVVLLIT